MGIHKWEVRYPLLLLCLATVADARKISTCHLMCRKIRLLSISQIRNSTSLQGGSRALQVVEATQKLPCHRLQN